MGSDSFHTRLCVLPHDDRVLTVQCTRVLTVHDRTQGPVELYVICLLARFVYAQRLFEQIYFDIFLITCHGQKFFRMFVFTSDLHTFAVDSRSVMSLAH